MWVRIGASGPDLKRLEGVNEMLIEKKLSQFRNTDQRGGWFWAHSIELLADAHPTEYVEDLVRETDVAVEFAPISDVDRGFNAERFARKYSS